MLKHLLGRLLSAVLVLWIIVTVTFFMLRLAPGGPFDMERTLPEDVLVNIEKKYHLDEPLIAQYIRYLKDILFKGDLGPSYKFSDRSVNDFIEEGFPVSLQLGFNALLVALILGLTMGITAALRHNTRWDYSAMILALVGVSLPSFVIGPLLQLIFGLRLGWFPIGGWEGFSYQVLPSLTLGSIYAASIARLSRGGMLEVTSQDYIRTARAKGLPERIVLFRHMIRGGLLPVVSYLGPATAYLFTGSLVVEKIFNIPGLGRHIVLSALNRDYTVVLGLVIVFSALILTLNLLVDFLYTVIDPRLRKT